MLQTADYARAVFLRSVDLHRTTLDTDEAGRSRIRRQEWLYEAGSPIPRTGA
ncbi:hypothetical protein [Streptomyces sp. NPDC001450]